MTDFENECFFITAIGKKGSDERIRSDGVLDAVVRPAAKEVGLEAKRADHIVEGGHVTLQVLEHCSNARAAVADLTGGNLNVYYEVGLRHALRMPVILIADESENGRLPFDLLQQRTVFYTNDMAGSASCRQAVYEQLQGAIDGHVDSPVEAAANLRALGEGTAVERTLAALVTKVEDLTSEVGRTGRRVRRIHPAAITDLEDVFTRLQVGEAGLSPDEVAELASAMERPLRHLARRLPEARSASMFAAGREQGSRAGRGDLSAEQADHSNQLSVDLPDEDDTPES